MTSRNISLRLRLKIALGIGLDVGSRDKARLTRLFLVSGPEGEGIRTLDVGCGNGYFSRKAARSSTTVVATTMLEGEHTKAKELFSALDLHNVDLRLTRLDDLEEPAESFDQVLLLDVLEHIRDDRGALSQIHGLLRKDRYLFLTFPNRDFEYWRDRQVFRYETGWHVRHGYTYEMIEPLLEECGYEPIDRRAFGTLGSDWGIRLQKLMGTTRSAPLLPLMELLRLVVPIRRAHTLLVLARKRD